jgi:predicted membrane protein
MPWVQSRCPQNLASHDLDYNHTPLWPAGKPDSLLSNKIPVGETRNGQCWYILGHLVFLTAIWYILWSLWYFLRPFGIFSVHFGTFYGHLVYVFYGHLVYFTAIWYILWSFGTFYGHLVYLVAIWYTFPVLVCCSKKNQTKKICLKRQNTVTCSCIHF